MKNLSYLPTFSRLMAAGLLALATASGALAQDDQDTDTDQQNEDEQVELEKISVTGSRIKRAGVDTFYPAISVGEQELEDNAYTNVADALNEIPSFGPADATPRGTQNTFSVGQNFVDFYGLGSQRTLTLVNGRRFVSSNTPVIFGETGGLQVDFNVIPLALVERIEVIGVGGAPIYGSDAIAGTINVITKDRFEGFEVTGQFGRDSDGDAPFHQGSLVAGANFADGRGNVTMSAETFHQDGLRLFERPELTRGDNDVFFASEDDNGERRIFRDQRINIFTNGGLIDPGAFIIPSLGIGALPDGNFYQFDSNSNLVPFTPGEPCPGSVFFACGGDGPDFFDNVDQAQSPLNRDVFTASMNYDLTDSVRVSSDILFANTDAVELSNQGGFQTFAFGGTSGALQFSADHPFLPQQARNVLAENGLDTFFVHRFNNDIIDPRNFREQFLWRFTTGLDGDFYIGDRNFNWEAYVVHGESDGESRREGIIDDRFLNAIDVRRLTAADLEGLTENDILQFSGTDSAGVGDVVCESVYQAALGNVTGSSGNGITDADLPFIQGCVPLNVFGENARSEAARAWVTGTQLTSTDIEQTVYNANFGGELFELPAGPFQFNVGYERRKEEAVFQPAIGDEVPLTRSAAFARTGGSYDTDEYYGEFLAPIVDSGMDIPGVHLFELNGAVREIDNSLAGSATVWTAGGRYAPVQDITFRGNYTESIRAPSLVELFAPITTSFSFANDPCDFRFVDEGPNAATRRANCQAELGAGYNPDEFASDIVNATARGRSGGNPDLENESAESYAVGVSIEPRWVDNLVVTLDYVDIQLQDAIQSLGLTSIMESCYDSPDFPNVSSCDRFTRNSEGQVVDFLTGQANAAQFNFEAIDFGAQYRFDMANALGNLNAGWGEKDLGMFSMNARIHHLREREISVVGEPTDPVIGGFNFPEYSGTFDFIWQLPNTRIFWRVLWQDDALLDPAGDDTFIDLDGNEVTSSGHRFINNASISYTLSDMFEGAPRDLVLQFTVDNVFDREPDTVQQAAGHFGFAELFGRSYTLGIRGSW